VAWVQLPLPVTKADAPSRVLSPAKALQLHESEDRVAVTGDGFDLTFSNAGLEQLTRGNRTIIAIGPRLQVWRGATDNDGIKGLPARTETALKRWLAEGVNDLVLGDAKLEASQSDGVVTVELRQSASCTASPRAIVQRQSYRIHPDGRTEVTCTFDVDPALADLPRLGVTLALPDDFEQVAWFGRGPLENYADRKSAAWIGRFAGTVREQHVPYAMPQEHGNKTELRWLELKSPHAAIRFTATGALFEGSVSRFTPADLFAAKHTTDLKERDQVLVNLDVAQRGLGTASCGPDTLEHYKLAAGKHTLAFEISVLD
jgi:beta-galactosidase